MLSALLLSAVVLGPPAGIPARAAASQDEPAIRLWLSDDGRYRRGDQADVRVKTRDDGYLLVLNVDPDGRLRVLFPLDPGDDNFVRGGKKYEILGRGGRKGFDVSNRSGQGTVYAAVSRAPFRFAAYVTNDHWDLGALDDVGISEKPEGDLNQFVQQLATADFDYDVLGYSVYERVVYGGPVYDDYAYSYDFGYPYGFYPCCYGGTSLFIGLSFGHHRRFYSPFFYDPFFYSPYYYPAYYYPYYYPTYHYYYPTYYYPRPYYPYPYAYYPYRPYSGGHFATPWRRRTVDPLAPGGFQWWRGREATFGTSTTLAGNYRSGFGRTFTPGRVPTATPVRGTVATTDAGTRRRSLDMTPARIEGSPTRGAIQPTERVRTPVARRAGEHNESWAGRVPERAGPRGNAATVPAARLRDVGGGRRPEARPSRSSEAVTRSRDQVAPAPERSGYEGQRVIQPRPEAHRAEDFRPASRPNIESGAMDRPAPVRMERSEPAPRMERSEPAPRMERGEPAPRMERGEPAPRMERSEPAPRMERSEPAPRMERSAPPPRMERSEPAPRGERGGGGGNRGGARRR